VPGVWEKNRRRSWSARGPRPWEGSCQLLPEAFEQVEPTAFGKQIHILGKRGEDTTGQELGNLLWVMVQFKIAARTASLPATSRVTLAVSREGSRGADQATQREGGPGLLL